jgi:medium-chain acyl-[acyl-carrier-protein] hydrolase
VRSAAEILSVNLRPYLNKPFAFFGHSLGAKICFEVARVLKATFGLEPFHLCVSGSSAPRFRSTRRQIYDLPGPQFLEELHRLNGTPPEVLKNVELMKLMLPVLRAEFAAAQKYVYVNGPPLDCPITAFGGLQDEEVTRDELQAWREETTRACSWHMLPGDHFFINSQPAALLPVLSTHLIESFSGQSIIPKITEKEPNKP